MSFGDYSSQPEFKFSSNFLINKNLNLPSNYKKKGLVAAEVNTLLEIGGVANNNRFTVNVPSDAGGAGYDITVRVVSGAPSDGTTNEVQVREGGDDAGTASRMLGVFNGNDGTPSSVYKFGAGSGDYTTGIVGVTAETGASTTTLTIAATEAGTFGNKIAFTDVAGAMVANGSAESSPAKLSGGTDIAAIPFALNTLGPPTLRNRQAAPYKSGEVSRISG